MEFYFSNLSILARSRSLSEATPASITESTNTSHHLGGSITGHQLLTLETLPAELKIQILSYLVDLEDLKAVVRASPVFHQQYLQDRRALLKCSVKETLSDVLVDARAVQASSSLRYQGRGLPMWVVRRFKRAYVNARSMPVPETLLDDCTTDDLAGMASFYLSVAQPLLLLSVAQPRFQDGSPLFREVNRSNETERERFLHALYRYRLCYNLFGAGHGPSAALGRFAGNETTGFLFSVFMQREVADIAGIHYYAWDRYRQIPTDA